jgi:hypothetical protein
MTWDHEKQEEKSDDRLNYRPLNNYFQYEVL